MSGPSERAVEAAYDALDGQPATATIKPWAEAKRALAAAHDHALGLDRSVRLRDVVEALREFGQSDAGVHQCASFIEREFGGKP